MGRGLKQVDIGNQISSSDTTGIVVITQTHPIDLVFTLPESDIATVVQAQKPVRDWSSKPGTAQQTEAERRFAPEP
jgi:hypothetical protein